MVAGTKTNPANAAHAPPILPTMDPPITVADSDSTVTSIEEHTENLCDNPTRDILADGVISVFKATADQLQESVRTTRDSQQELRVMLDGLSAKLRTVQRAQETPPVFEEYVRKLISVKHKVTVIYNVLNTTQASVGAFRGRLILGYSSVSQYDMVSISPSIY